MNLAVNHGFGLGFEDINNKEQTANVVN